MSANNQNYDLLKSLEGFNSNVSLLGQIKDRFIYSHWKVVYRKDSWRGRIAAWLQYPSERKKATENAYKVFAVCLQSLGENQRRDFSYEFLLKAEEELSLYMEQRPSISDQFKIAELDSFDQLAASHQLEFTTNAIKGSYLKNHTAVTEVSSKQFKAIFTNKQGYFSEVILLLRNFFRICPKKAVPDWEKKLRLLQQGNRAAGVIREKIDRLGHKPSIDALNDSAKEIAKDFSKRIYDLKPGESYQINCYYGMPELTIDTLFVFLRRLPNFIKKPLESNTKGGFAQDSVELSEKLTFDLLDAFFSELKKEKNSSCAPDVLFSNDARELPEVIHNVLPVVISEFLAEMHKSGLVKNLSGFAYFDELKELMLWISDQGDEVKSHPNRFINELEQKIQKISRPLLKKILHEIDSSINSYGSHLKELIPPFYFEALGFKFIFEHGPIWFKATRLENGKFSLAVSTLGSNLANHKVPDEDLISPVLSIHEIDPQKLDEVFLQRVIFQYMTSLTNKQHPSIDSLYKGPLEMLSGQKAYPYPDKKENFSTVRSTEADLALTTLFEGDCKKIFEFRLGVFLDYWTSLFDKKENKLLVSDRETLGMLLRAAEDLEKDARLIYQKDPDQLKAITATKHEVEMIVKEAKLLMPSEEAPDDFILPPQLLSIIQEILSAYYISKETVEKIKNTLVGILGEELGDLIDSVLPAFNNLLPEKNNAAKKLKNLVEGKDFISYYSLLTTKMTVTALIATGLWNAGFSYLFLIPVGRLILPYLLPKELTDPYFRIEKAVLRSMAQLICKIVLHFTAGSVPVKYVQNFLQQAANTFTAMAKNLQGNGRISYMLNLTEETSPKHGGSSSAKKVAIVSRVNDDKKTYVIEPSSEEILTKRLADVLTILNETSSSNQVELSRYIYFAKEISALPIPGEGCFWETVDNPEELIPLLSDLGTWLNDFFVTYKFAKAVSSKVNSLREERHAEIIALTYHLLAIIDCLVRRQTDLKLPAKTNAYPLLIWLSRKGSFVKDSQTMLHIRKICHYFFPGLELDSLPSIAQLEKRSKDSLFNSYLYKDDNHLRLSRAPFLSYKLPELRFLEGLLKDPSCQQKLRDNYSWTEQCSRAGTMEALLDESFNFSKRNAELIPKGYKYLKRATLFATQSTHQTIPRKGSCRQSSYCSTISKAGLFDHMGIHTDSRALPDYAENGYKIPQPRSSPAGTMFNEHSLDQCEVIETSEFDKSLNKQAKQLKINSEELKRLHLILSEPREQLLRAIEWFQRRKDVYRATKNFATEVLDACFFNPGRIERQLKESPSSAMAICNFFNDLYHFHLKENNIETSLRLVYFALKAKSFIKAFAPDHLQYFPPFSSLLEDLIETRPLSENHLSAAYMLLALICEKEENPEKEEGLDKLSLYLCLGILALPQTFFGKDAPFQEFNGLCCDFVSLYNVHIKKIVKHANFSKILNSVYNKKLKAVKLDGELSWERSSLFPYVFSSKINEVLVDFSTGTFFNAFKIIGILDEKLHSFRVSYGLTNLQFVSETYDRKKKYRFVSTDQAYMAEFVFKSKRQFEIYFFRVIDGSTYELIESEAFSSHIRKSPLIPYTHLKIKSSEGPLAIWKKISDDRMATYAVHTRKEPNNLAFFQAGNQSSWRYTDLIYLSGPNREYPLYAPRLKDLKLNLRPITSLCSFRDIDCIANCTTGEIHHLSLLQGKLLFDVKEDKQGIKRAYCTNTELAGYSIIPTQKYTFLKKFNGCLVLEKGTQKIVLLRTGQEFLAPFWKLSANFGDLGRFIMKEVQTGFPFKDYFAYQVSREGKLVSNDPAAIAFLFTLYLLQGYERDAFDQLKKLEKILNSQAIADPERVYNQLKLILFADSNDYVSYMRLRLVAAFGRNGQIQRTTNANETSFAQILLCLIIYFDYPRYLKSNNPYLKLSLAQEYFLHHFFNATARDAIPTEDIPKTVKSILEVITLHSCENFLLPTEIKDRWDSVRKTWGVNPPRTYQMGSKFLNVLLPKAFVTAIPKIIKQTIGPIRWGIKFFDEATIIKAFEKLPEYMKLTLTLPPLTAEDFNHQNLKIYFASYYSIARKEFVLGGKNEWKQLGKLLQFYKEGWGDGDSELLINLLDMAYHAPFNPFSSTRLINEAAGGLSPECLSKKEFTSKAVLSAEVKDLAHKIKELKQEAKSLEKKLMKDKGKEKIKDGGISSYEQLDLLQSRIKGLEEDYKRQEEKLKNLAVEGWSAFIRQLSEILHCENLLVWQRDAVIRRIKATDKTANPLYRSERWMTATSFVPKAYKALITTASSIAPGSKRLQSTKVAERELVKIQRDRVNQDPYNPPSYSPIKDKEEVINGILEEFFSLVYLEVEVPVPDNFVKPFEYGGKDPFTSNRFAYVNRSLQAHYNARSENKVELRVVNPQGLKHVYFELIKLQSEWKAQLKLDKERLVKAFSFVLQHEKHISQITFNEMWHYIKTFKNSGPGKPSVEHVQQLELALAQYEHLNSRLNQIEGILRDMKSLESLLDIPFEQLNHEQLGFVEEKLELIADGLQTKTGFDFEKTPNSHLISYLRLQSKSGLMIWPRQARLMGRQMKEKNDLSLGQLPCGYGKTIVAGPIMLDTLANGQNVVFFLSPKAVSGTLFTTVSGLLDLIFGRTSHRHKHARNIPLDESALEALYVTLVSARKEGEITFQNREDFEALYGIFIDHLHFYITKGHSNEQSLIHLRNIFALIFDHGYAVIDEGHEVYNQRKITNLPFGQPKTVNESYFNTITICMRLLYENPIARKAIRRNKVYNIPREIYRKEIIHKIAKKLCLSFNIREKLKKQEFKAFFCKKLDVIPEWLVNHPKYEEICLAKGVITSLVNRNRKQRSRSNVDYGASKTKPEEFARPFAGNTNAIEDSTIQDPFETLVKTFLYILSTGLTKQQTIRLFSELNKKITMEMKRRNTEIDKTTVWEIVENKKLREFLMQSDGLDENSPLWDTVVAKVNKTPKILFFYIKTFIWKQIKYWNYSVQVDAQKFSTLIKSQRTWTATPYNDTYPASLKMLKELETVGESIHTLSANCPDAKVAILQNNEPGKPLLPLEIMYKIFDQFLRNPLYTLIIDGGALFTGLESEFIAREMLIFAKKHRDDIDAVDFFKKDEQGIYQVYILNDPEGIPVLEDEENCDYKRRLSYIEHSQGIAANLKQRAPGYGLETIGPLHPLYRVIQESYRELRDPKKERRLQSIVEGRVTNRAQMISFVTTEEIAALINEDEAEKKSVSLTQLFKYAIKSEGKIVAKDNKDSLGAKFRSIPHAIIFEKMLHADFDEMIELYKRFEKDLFLTKLITSPSALWGNIQRRIEAEKAVDLYADSVIEKFENTGILSKEEELDIKSKIKNMPLPPLPEKLTVYDKGNGNVQLGLMAQFNQQMQVQQETSVEEHAEQELQLEHTNHIEQQQAKHIYDEFPWPEFKLDSLSWLTLTDLLKKESRLSGLTSFFKAEECNFYSIRDLLAISPNQAFVASAEFFDEALWCTNNWLPHKPSIFLSEPVAIGSGDQRDLFDMLIHFVEDEAGITILKAAPISMHDATIWRDKMAKQKELDPDFWDKQEIKVVVWDVHSHVISAGYQPKDTQAFANNAQLQRCVVSMKFINGDVDYGFYLEALEKWVATVSDPISLFESFKIIHANRGKNDFLGSDVDYVFSQNKSYYIY